MTFILSNKIQKANNVWKDSQKLYILLLKKANFVEVLLNLSRYHCSHMVLKILEEIQFLFAKSFGWFDRISSCTSIYCLQYCTYFFIMFPGRKSHTFFLLVSYPLLLYEWIGKIKTTHIIFLNPKSLAQTFTAIGWKN